MFFVYLCVICQSYHTLCPSTKSIFGQSNNNTTNEIGMQCVQLIQFFSCCRLYVCNFTRIKCGSYIRGNGTGIYTNIWIFLINPWWVLKMKRKTDRKEKGTGYFFCVCVTSFLFFYRLCSLVTSSVASSIRCWSEWRTHNVWVR